MKLSPTVARTLRSLDVDQNAARNPDSNQGVFSSTPFSSPLRYGDADAAALSMQRVTPQHAARPTPQAATINGTPGPDTLTGTPGDDIIDGGAGADQMTGLAGNDIYYVDNAGDVVTEASGEGTDDVRTTLQQYSLPTNVENLTGTAGAGTQILTGNSDNNVITGYDSFRSWLIGGAGNDTLIAFGTEDFLEGGTGDDIYLVSSSDAAYMVENAGAGYDIAYAVSSFALKAGVEIERLSIYDWSTTFFANLTGNEFNNLIEGNAVANQIDGGAGADIMVGFGGNDGYTVDNINDQVIEAANGGDDSISLKGVSYTIAPGSAVEFLRVDSFFSSFAAYTLIGNEFAQTIFGGIHDDFINGGGGADYMRGFDGNDTFIVDNIGDTVDAEGGSDVVYALVDFVASGASIDRISTIDWSATTAINLTGGSGDNLIEGNAGANRLDGAGGADTLIGFGGDDTFVINNTGDRVFENAGGGNDTVKTTIDFQLFHVPEVENLLANDPASTGVLRFHGNASANRIDGNNGINLLDGQGGVDQLTGFLGDDIYVVDNAGDTVIEASGGGFDEVYAFNNYTLQDGTFVERLSSVDWTFTNALDLSGNSFDNLVQGNAGANVLNGRGGNDELQGFGGADGFAFTTALGAGNVDTIRDFVAVDDTILLDDAVFAGLSTGALNPNAFVIGTAAGDADDRIIYNSTTGQLFFDADGNGASAAVQFALLQGAPVITAGDFMVI